MNNEEVKLKLKACIINLIGVTEDEIQDSTNLHTDLGLDSLDYVELVMEVEKDFNIAITDDELGQINTFEEYVNLICKHLKITI